LVGTSVVDFTLINHPSGPEELYGTEIFSGSASGVGTGTLELAINASGPAPGVFSGQAIVLSGTADLAGLQGITTFESPPPTYSVMFVKH
jgi:hypothetical protein